MGFILKDSNKDKSLIILSYDKVIGKSPFRYSTGLVVEANHWDKSNQSALTRNIEKNKISFNININNQLSKYQTFLQNTIDSAKLQGFEITKQFLKQQFDSNFKEIEIKIDTKETDLATIWNQYINELVEGKRLTKKKTNFSVARIKKYKVILNKVLEYFNGKASVNDLDEEFLRNYTAYRNKGKVCLNTLSTDFMILRSVLRATHKDGLHNNRLFENENLNIAPEATEKEFLSDAELDILYHLKLDKEYHKRTRDVFLVGCYTGLRISDLSTLNMNNLINGRLIKVIQEKTNEPVFIPLHWRVIEIMERYDNAPPKAYSDQKMNVYIKEICKIAGFDEKAYFSQTRGGKVQKFVKEKWERMTNHTARRSFATNLYLAGFDTLTIMKLTGHKTETAFMGYICVTQRQMADRIKDHPYFMKQL